MKYRCSRLLASAALALAILGFILMTKSESAVQAYTSSHSAYQESVLEAIDN